MGSLNSTDRTSEILKEIFGPYISFFDGTAQIAVSETKIVNVAFVDDGEMLLSAAADVSADLDNQDVLRLLLSANHLGVGTGNGRLGVRMGSLVLSERVHAEGLDRSALEARINGFLAHLAFWSDDAAARRLQPPVPLDFSEALIRV